MSRKLLIIFTKYSQTQHNWTMFCDNTLSLLLSQTGQSRQTGQLQQNKKTPNLYADWDAKLHHRGWEKTVLYYALTPLFNLLWICSTTKNPHQQIELTEFEQPRANSRQNMICVTKWRSKPTNNILAKLRKKTYQTQHAKA